MAPKPLCNLYQFMKKKNLYFLDSESPDSFWKPSRTTGSLQKCELSPVSRAIFLFSKRHNRPAATNLRSFSFPPPPYLFELVPVVIQLADHHLLQLLRLEDVHHLHAAHFEEARLKLLVGCLHRVAEGVLDIGGDKLLPEKTQRSTAGRTTWRGSAVSPTRASATAANKTCLILNPTCHCF